MKLIITFILLISINAFSAEDFPRPDQLSRETRDDLLELEEKIRDANLITIFSAVAQLHGLVAIGADIEGLFELFITPYLQWKFNGDDSFEGIGSSLALELPATSKALLKREIDFIHLRHEQRNNDVKFWRVFSEIFTRDISFKCPLGVYTGKGSGGLGADIRLCIYRGESTCYRAGIQLRCCGRSSNSELDFYLDGSQSEKFGRDVHCVQRDAKIKGEYHGTFDEKYFTISDFELSLHGNRIWVCTLRK